MSFAASASSSHARPAKPEGLWSELYAPRTQEDLVIAKAKVEVLKEFLQEYVAAGQQGRRSNSRLLVIKGPSGCGKYISLKVLCDQLGIGINEWQQGDQYEPGEGGISGDLFKFLRRSHGCGRLAMRGAKNTHSAYNVSIIKDFPFETLKDRSWSSNYSRDNDPGVVFRNILHDIAQPAANSGARAPVMATSRLAATKRRLSRPAAPILDQDSALCELRAIGAAWHACGDDRCVRLTQSMM